ncbi:hypothetical protein ACFUJR_30205 [Streptomyces sp. NPDC057271]|uniref:hypothetical protein n=1 Tax=unclassified Streptomyces TaxID=2593676 RepID=UPI003644AE4A
MIERTRRIPGRDAPQALVRALREAPGGVPDDVLVVCLDWHGRGGEGRAADQGARHS